VRVTGDDRYDLHELTRQYAGDKLRLAGQEAQARRQHAAAYLALAEQFVFTGPGAIAAYAHLEQEHDNFRAALSWALEAGEAETALRLVNGLRYFWFRRGYWLEAVHWMTAAVDHAGDKDSVPLCRALLGLMQIHSFLRQVREASTSAARALPMARRLEDPLSLAESLNPVAGGGDAIADLAAILQESDDPRIRALLAMFHMLYGDQLLARARLPEAAEQYQQSLAILRQLGNVDIIAYPLGNLGRLALQAGRLSEAYDLIAESVAISRYVGNRVGIADWLQQLGKAALYLGDLTQGEACLEEALALYDETGSSQIQVHALAVLGHVALARGDEPRAASLLRESLSAAQRAESQAKQTEEAAWLVPFLRPDTLDALARRALVAVAQSELERAVTLFSGIAALCQQSRYTLESPLQAEVEQAMKVVRSQMAEAAFEHAWEKGRQLTLDEALAYAQEA
jgi:tetratricopeptide (TPR) repeat protein